MAGQEPWGSVEDVAKHLGITKGLEDGGGSDKFTLSELSLLPATTCAATSMPPSTRTKAELKASERKQSELVQAGTTEIDREIDRACEVILERMSLQSYIDYLVADQWARISALDNLHAKYTVTGGDIERARDAAAMKTYLFLGELGYA